MFIGRRIPVGNLDDVASTHDRLIPGPDGDLGVRIYRPREDGGPRPAVVFCHGGGFVLCDLDTHDGFRRSMSRHTEPVVVSVITGSRRSTARTRCVRGVLLGDG